MDGLISEFLINVETMNLLKNQTFISLFETKQQINIHNCFISFIQIFHPNLYHILYS